MLQATVPVYITELAPTQLRGALVNLCEIRILFELRRRFFTDISSVMRLCLQIVCGSASDSS